MMRAKKGRFQTIDKSEKKNGTSSANHRINKSQFPFIDRFWISLAIVLVVLAVVVQICQTRHAETLSRPESKPANYAKNDTQRDWSPLLSTASDYEQQHQEQFWSQERVQLVVEYWNETIQPNDRGPVQIDYTQALLELGNQRLRDIRHRLNRPEHVIRFLLARSGNVDATERMFRNMVAWRKREGADTILQNPPPTPVIKNIPGSLLQDYDRDGDPIFLERFLLCDGDGILKHYGRHALHHHAIWIRETVSTRAARLYEERQQRPLRQLTVIVDMKGLSRKHLKRKLIRVFGETARLDQDNYPEYAKRIILIRVPVLFRMIWPLVKHFIDKNIASKMILSGKDNFATVLSRYVDLKVLPSVIVPQDQGRVEDELPSNWDGGPLALYLATATYSNAAEPRMSPAKAAALLYEDCWNKESIALVVERRNLNDRYLESLLNLRLRLRNVQHPMNCAQDVSRFLIARSGDTDAAEAMFRKSIAWREEVGADTILHHPPPQPIIDNIPGAVIEGCDKDGDPIFIERFISADLFGIISRYGKEALIHHAIWLRESVAKGSWIQEYEKVHGNIPDRLTVIVDMEGLSRRHAHRNVIEVFEEVSRLCQDHYPEGAKRRKSMILIRAPMAFRLIWTIIRPFIDPLVASKIVLCGKDNYREVLSEYVDLKILPAVIVEEGQGRVVKGLPPDLHGGRLSIPFE